MQHQSIAGEVTVRTVRKSLPAIPFAALTLICGMLLTAPDVRRILRALCGGAFPEVAVLAYGELEPSLRVWPLGRLSLDAGAS